MLHLLRSKFVVCRGIRGVREAHFLCRSMLYTPGDKLNALRKSLTLDADKVIFDLEDAVSPANKENARSNVSSLLSEQSPHLSKVAVRINCPFTSPWGRDDIKMLLEQPVRVPIILPKVESAESISRTKSLLQQHASSTPLYAMIETPLGVIHVDSIAATTVSCIIFGSNDYAKCLQVPLHRSALQYAHSRTINAAKAFQTPVIDGVYMDLTNEGLEEDVAAGKALGFDGKSLIHPKQIAATNRIYTPTSEEVEAAREIIAAHAAAQLEGVSLVVVRGRLIEQLHVDEAYRIIEMFEYIKSSC